MCSAKASTRGREGYFLLEISVLLFSYLSFYLSLWGVCLFATEKKEAVFFFSLLIKKSGFFLSFFFTLLQSREPLRDVLDDLRRVIIPRLLVEEVAGHDQREDGGAEGLLFFE